MEGGVNQQAGTKSKLLNNVGGEIGRCKAGRADTMLVLHASLKHLILLK